VASRVPDRVALQGRSRDAPRYTYRETIERAKQVGHGLLKGRNHDCLPASSVHIRTSPMGHEH
jgi:hypothetical protein